jgi:hypothetical protein
VLKQTPERDPVLRSWRAFSRCRRIKELGDRKRIEILILAPSFLEFAERNQIYLHGFGDTKEGVHWNEAGHKPAGELIAEKLTQML